MSAPIHTPHFRTSSGDIPHKIGETPQITELTKRISEMVFSNHQNCLLQCMPKLNQYGLSFLQYFLLQRIQEGNNTITMTQVAKASGHSMAAATGQIDRLTELGYVSRRQDPADHRKILVSITELGQTVLQDLDNSLRNSILEGLHQGEDAQ